MTQLSAAALRALSEVEASSRRCLICANINPCSEHSGHAQREELRRNDAAIAEIRANKLPSIKTAD